MYHNSVQFVERCDDNTKVYGSNLYGTFFFLLRNQKTYFKLFKLNHKFIEIIKIMIIPVLLFALPLIDNSFKHNYKISLFLLIIKLKTIDN